MKKYGLTTLSLMALSGSITFNSHAAVVINEIDYDQPGTDTAEFIELYNSGSSSVSLDAFSVELINGTNSSSYRTIDLSGFNISASGYFVMCDNASTVANCDYSFTSTGSWFQNGAPDAVALFENDGLIDSLTYEGSLLRFTEGDEFSPGDNNSDITSIGRITDGHDTNNNALDFQMGCITPGSANIGGMGDCSAPNLSAVPIPAAVWLFGTGLIGLIGVARRK